MNKAEYMEALIDDIEAKITEIKSVLDKMKGEMSEEEKKTEH